VVGDLVSFVTSNAAAIRLGLGPEQITPFVAEAGDVPPTDIFAAEAPVIGTILVGTSYSADDRWSFAPALSLALGRDVLDLAQEGQGPIRPLRALFEDPGVEANPPEYVIWEFPVRYLADPQIWPDDPAFDAVDVQQGIEE
jgi:alginate O-acetyltransferase complex protein AlgJ